MLMHPIVCHLTEKTILVVFSRIIPTITGVNAIIDSTGD